MKFAIVLNLLTVVFLCVGSMVAVGVASDNSTEEAYEISDDELLEVSEEFNICPEVLETMIELGDVSDIESTCEELNDLHVVLCTDDMMIVLTEYYGDPKKAELVLDKSFVLEEFHGKHDYSEYLNSQIQ